MASRNKKKLNTAFLDGLSSRESIEAKLAFCEEYGPVNGVTRERAVALHCDLDKNTIRRLGERGARKRFLEGHFPSGRQHTMDAILSDIGQWQDHLDLLDSAGLPWAEIETYRQHKARVAAERKATAEREKWLSRLHGEILLLTPTRRLDAILKDERGWSAYRSDLEQAGIPWSQVQDRKGVVQERERLRDIRRAEKAERALNEQLESARKIAEANSFSSLHVTDITFHPEERRPVRIRVNMVAATAGLPRVAVRPVAYAVRHLFRGFVASQNDATGHECLEASIPVFLRLSQEVERIERMLAAIRDLQPGTLELINSPEAVELSGLSKPAFDDALGAGLIPVADTEQFRKWGRVLTANRFEIRDIMELRNSGVFADFVEKREKKKAASRRQGAMQAGQTRIRRSELRVQIAEETRQKARSIARATGDLAAAHQLELFIWAQRASRLAKTRPSQKEEAYKLKDHALLCLCAIEALEVSFVNAGQIRLVSKCTYHAEDWHYIEDLFLCPVCRTRPDHYRSLYAMRLKHSPMTGTLHLPYPLGRHHGLADMSQLPAADHDISCAYGRRLDEDEVALFPIETIRREIERLCSTLIPEEDGSD